MLLRPKTFDVRAVKAAAVAVALSCLISPAYAPLASAQGASPFAPFAGSWSGTGTIETTNGNERIRCRATYDVNGKSLQLNLRCASDSYNFNLTSNVHYDGGAISGTWSELTRNASGHISGHVSGNQILVSAEGASFAANLLMVTRGDRQSVSIRASGADIHGVSIALSRR
jgi:hypothetical protein